ncbi:hypothetical protein ABZ769_27100 [Streptomyces olivoreticuli]
MDDDTRESTSPTDIAFFVFLGLSAPVFFCFLFEEKAPAILPAAGWSLQTLGMLVLIGCFTICAARKEKPSAPGWVWTFFTVMYALNNSLPW